ncbi:unnamed protein product [Ilex paraguariensis]|uniref:Uncharacterized protein n=1 Tax=Ilex paraguariensis TaxID=185542 RepID=A0ABC8RRX3_9AQUA
MITESKAANAVGGKTARACDSCLRKRARWFCPADDAFLCQVCDASVHSANQLASRHERVRLETSSFKAEESRISHNSVPPWLQGFTRKPRTPRKPKNEEKITNPLLLVPELGSDETYQDRNEEQLLYLVPVFDPFAAELCNGSNEMDNSDEKAETVRELNDFLTDTPHDEAYDLGFLPSDAEFAADVESLLGTGFDGDSCCMEGIGLMDCKEEEGIDFCFEEKRVKVEDGEAEAVMACNLVPALDMEREGLDWSFEFESAVANEEKPEEKVVVSAETVVIGGEGKAEVRREMLLRLNYDEVITAWANQGTPWAAGIRSEFHPDDCWADFMGSCSSGVHHHYGGIGGRMGGDDGGREARVSRYKEKRRTRLFSKKIRYEVRKLNAEKRPRMKGRFVKRT